LIRSVCEAFWNLKLGFAALGLELISIPLAYISYQIFEKQVLKFKKI